MWGAVWDRLSPVTTVIGALGIVAFLLTLGTDGGPAEAAFALMASPSMHYAKFAFVAAALTLASCIMSRPSKQGPA